MTPQHEHPTHAAPTPPFPEQKQQPPGREADMRPLADHGEDSYVGHGRLEGKVALITGGDSGIGRAVAIAFAREGADILVSYWKEDEDAAATSALVGDAGRRCLIVPGDIGDRAHCRALVDRAVGELGRLDVLINNAALPDELRLVSGDPRRRAGVRVPHQRAGDVPPLPGGGPDDGAGLHDHQHDVDPGPAAEPAAAALRDHQGAISTFTKGLAQEVAERGIRVNAVAPARSGRRW
jgi:NAD(P)-dependent dehydrogenase (short-subunit alcohol dehydrogenase family)